MNLRRAQACDTRATDDDSFHHSVLRSTHCCRQLRAGAERTPLSQGQACRHTRAGRGVKCCWHCWPPSFATCAGNPHMAMVHVPAELLLVGVGLTPAKLTSHWLFFFLFAFL